MPQQPIYVGQWIKGDEISDLLVYALKPDKSANPFDLTGVTEQKLLLRCRDRQLSIDVDGEIVTDGSVQLEDGTPVTSATQGVLRFADITADWAGPASGIEEAFDAWVRIVKDSKPGYLRPYFSLSFRKAP